ncbi:hypothetical protein HAX54_000611, partial [Datura stramonium]|nr:hypothetical protein [Datura stramonium]
MAISLVTDRFYGVVAQTVEIMAIRLATDCHWWGHGQVPLVLMNHQSSDSLSLLPSVRRELWPFSIKGDCKGEGPSGEWQPVTSTIETFHPDFLG